MPESTLQIALNRDLRLLLSYRCYPSHNEPLACYNKCYKETWNVEQDQLCKGASQYSQSASLGITGIAHCPAGSGPCHYWGLRSLILQDDCKWGSLYFLLADVYPGNTLDAELLQLSFKSHWLRQLKEVLLPLEIRVTGRTQGLISCRSVCLSLGAFTSEDLLRS